MPGLVSARRRGRGTPAPWALGRASRELGRAAAILLACGQRGSRRGERDLALDWLDKAYATPHAELPMLKADPGLRSLRTHPRFVALLKAMKLPAD